MSSERFLFLAVHIAWKLSKYGLFTRPYFPICGLNTGKYGLESTPYFDTFHTVSILGYLVTY